MSPLNPWVDFMKNVIQWQVLDATDPYDENGMPLFGTAVDIKCRIVNKERMIRSLDGQEIISKTTIYCDGYHGVEVEDQITLPNGDVPKMLRINTYPDEMSHKYEEILT